MNNINQELFKEIEKRASGKLKDIATDILMQINEDFTSDVKLKDEIRRKVEFAVLEEAK